MPAPHTHTHTHMSSLLSVFFYTHAAFPHTKNVCLTKGLSLGMRDRRTKLPSIYPSIHRSMVSLSLFCQSTVCLFVQSVLHFSCLAPIEGNSAFGRGRHSLPIILLATGGNRGTNCLKYVSLARWLLKPQHSLFFPLAARIALQSLLLLVVLSNSLGKKFMAVY